MGNFTTPSNALQSEINQFQTDIANQAQSSAQQNNQQYLIAQNTADSHQAQPWALIMVLHYTYPNTWDLPSPGQAFNSDNNKTGSTLFTDDAAIQISKVLIRSDILSVTVSHDKSSIIGAASATLVPGQTEYENLILPGDHAFIWMHNDISVLQDVVNQVNNNTAANSFTSGLKFYGKVESCRKIFTTTESGVKTIRYNVNFKSFSEFNAQIYFNPVLQNQDDPGQYKFYGQLSQAWDSFTSTNNRLGLPIFTPSATIPALVNLFFGIGPGSTATGQKLQQARSPVSAFIVPNAVANIFGSRSPSHPHFTFADVLNTIVGIQKYPTSQSYMMPSISQENLTGNQKQTTVPLSGVIPSLPEPFTNQTMESIIKQVSVSEINEMYCTLRADENGFVNPTMIVRQVPFTTPRFTAKYSNAVSNVTMFTELPLWTIDPSVQIGTFNIGTSDTMRINYTQFVGMLFNSNIPAPSVAALQMGSNNSDGSNFVEDTLDILRSGGRNLLVQSNVLLNLSVSPQEQANYCADLMADWYQNGHLKLNGSIMTPGIPEPICIGDNLAFDGKIFHIEHVTHSYSMSGINKLFRTTMQLSQGILANGQYPYKSGTSIDQQSVQYGRTAESNADISGADSTGNTFADSSDYTPAQLKEIGEIV